MSRYTLKPILLILCRKQISCMHIKYSIISLLHADYYNESKWETYHIKDTNIAFGISPSCMTRINAHVYSLSSAIS